MDNLITVNNLVKHFPVSRGIFDKKDSIVHAVDGVSFSIKKEETLGLVGESGCGKSTLGKMLARLLEPTSGEISYRDQDQYWDQRKRQWTLLQY